MSGSSVTLGTGNSVVVSFSLSVNELLQIQDIMVERNYTRSAAIRYLIRMGLVYLRVLDEQKPENRSIETSKEDS